MTKEFDNSHKIDNLEQRLYSPRRDVEANDRKKLRQKDYSVAGDWEHPPEEKNNDMFALKPHKRNWFMTFFVLAFLFFIGAAAFVGYKFVFESGIEAKNVDILVNAPLTIGAGEVFAFDVLLQNKNEVNMDTVDMIVSFPEGSRSSEDISKNYPVVQDELGSIAVGSVVKKNYNVLLFGEEGDKKEIIVALSYRVEGSNLIIEKEKKFEVILKSTPIRLTVTNIKDVTSGEQLSFNIELVSNSTQILSNVIVRATYPFGFEYQNSSLQPKDDKKTWIIERLEPKETVKFTVDGVLNGQNNEERYFSFVAGLEDQDTGNPQVVFNTVGTTITLERPFLELDLTIDKKSSDLIVINPQLVYTSFIQFKNNTDIQLRDATIDLQLIGSAIDKFSVQTSDGFYQSTNNTITFDASTTNKLRAIPIGSSGELIFNFAGSTFLNGNILVNPEVSMVAKVRANRNPENEVPEIIENSITKKIRFNTQAKIETSSQYYNSVFANTGPVPPKAEQKTTYTLVFEASNTSNKITDAVMSANIPGYVNFDGIYSPNTADFSYDQNTRTIFWKIGTIDEKTGYLGNSKKRLSVQVSLLPSFSQIGTTPNLATDIQFRGVDAYTRANISQIAPNINTAITESKTFYDSQVSR